MAVVRKLTQNFIATQVDGEILIVDLDRGELYSLTGSAKAVWEAIDGTRSDAEIAALMADMFQGDEQAIASDLEALVGEFEKAALVERVALC